MFDKEKFLKTPCQDDVIKVCFIGPYKELFQCFYEEDGRWKIFTKTTKEENSKCVKRMASFVIDRLDSNKLKAFLCPISVWSKIKKEDRNKDFQIRKIGYGIETQFLVDCLGKSIITAEQEQTVKTTLSKFSFEDIYIHNKDWEFSIEIFEPIESRFEILDLYIRIYF